MIVAKRKPFDEIMQLIKGYKKVLVVGCGTCVAVCLAGGEKEVAVLTTELDMGRKLANNPVAVGVDHAGAAVRPRVPRPAGRHGEGLRRPHLHGLRRGHPVPGRAFPGHAGLPGGGHLGLAVNQDVGWYEERCRSCGRCVLGLTGGICPVTMCAKGLYNGPCGGTNKGSCEINADQPCAWFNIYERLKAQGRLDCIWRCSRPRSGRTPPRGRWSSPATRNPKRPRRSFWTTHISPCQRMPR